MSNFAITKVVARNLFVSFFASILYISSWLLFFALHKVITISKCNEKLLSISSLNDNLRERNQEKKQRIDTKNETKKIKSDREKCNVDIAILELFAFW